MQIDHFLNVLCCRRRHELSVTTTKELSKVEIEDIFTKSLVNHLNRVLVSGLALKAKHLNATTVSFQIIDYNPS